MQNLFSFCYFVCKIHKTQNPTVFRFDDAAFFNFLYLKRFMLFYGFLMSHCRGVTISITLVKKSSTLKIN